MFKLAYTEHTSEPILARGSSKLENWVRVAVGLICGADTCRTMFKLEFVVLY